MIRNLTATSLGIEQLPQAFPLARALVSNLDLEAWLAFARRRSGDTDTGGIVGVCDERGYFHGLFGYEVRQDLAQGTTLAIDMAIAMELLDRGGAAAVLIGEIDGIAAKLGCRAVHVRLRPEQRGLRRGLERAGHQVQGIILGKPANRPHASSRGDAS
jgi:hypothetical protein